MVSSDADAAAADQDARAPARPVAVADRVGQEVLQHAAQQGRIALGDGVGRDVAQLDALLLGDRRERRDQRIQQRAERHRAHLRLDRAGIELGDVEQRVEQGFDRAQAVIDLLHQVVARMPLRHRGHEQARRVQRLQQVVAGGGDEAGLVDVGLFGLGAGRFQLGGALDDAPLQRFVGDAQGGLGAAPLGDVDIEQEEADHLALGVEMRQVGAARHLDLRVVGRELDLEMLRRAGQHRLDIGQQAMIARLAQDLAHVAAFGLGFHRAHGRLVDAVGEAVALVAVDIGDQHRDIVGDDADAPLAVAQGLGGAHALGHVAGGHHDAAAGQGIDAQLGRAAVGEAQLAHRRRVPGGELGQDRRAVGQLRRGHAGAEQLARDADQRGEALVPDLQLAFGVEHRDAEADVIERLAQQVGVVADRGGGVVQHLAHRARHPQGAAARGAHHHAGGGGADGARQQPLHELVGRGAGERDAGEGLGGALLADEAGGQLLQLRQVARLPAGFRDRRVGVGIAHEGLGLALVAALRAGQQRDADQQRDIDRQARPRSRAASDRTRPAGRRPAAPAAPRRAPWSATGRRQNQTKKPPARPAITP